MRENVWTQQRADSMLALVAMAWGSSYLLMKIGLDGIPPFCIIALRFGIAFVAVSLLFFKQFKKTTKRVMMKGAVLGLFLFGSAEYSEYFADNDRYLSVDIAAVTGFP